jgi:hypothetical protein
MLFISYLVEVRWVQETLPTTTETPAAGSVPKLERIDEEGPGTSHDAGPALASSFGTPATADPMNRMVLPSRQMLRDVSISPRDVCIADHAAGGLGVVLGARDEHALMRCVRSNVASGGERELARQSYTKDRLDVPHMWIAP